MLFAAQLLKAQTRVPSALRALELLEELSSSNRRLTLSEISRKLRIPRSSAYYLIQGLASQGYLVRNPWGRDYALGPRVANLANEIIASSELATLCAPYSQKLAENLQLPAQVGILVGAEVCVINRSGGSRGIGLHSWVGRHMDLHCTALGKALIAYHMDMEFEKIFRHRGFPKYTARSLGSLPALRAHLSEVRVKGFAVDNEELETGVKCTAAPIFDRYGKVVAAIGVFGSTSNIPDLESPRVCNAVASFAKEISRYR